MANKLTNQSGNEVFAAGQEGSHIRNREQFNVTIYKLLRRIDRNCMHDGIERHTGWKELEFICEDDNVPKDNWKSLIASAYFYWHRMNEDFKKEKPNIEISRFVYKCSTCGHTPCLCRIPLT